MTWWLQDEPGQAEWEAEVTTCQLIAARSPFLHSMTPHLLASGRLPPLSHPPPTHRPAPHTQLCSVPRPSASQGLTRRAGEQPDSSAQQTRPADSSAVAPAPLAGDGDVKGLPSGFCVDSKPSEGPPWPAAGLHENPTGPLPEEGAGMCFVVATRLTGTPWADVEDALSMQDKLAVARQLGHALAHFHSLPCPAARSSNMDAASTRFHGRCSTPATSMDISPYDIPGPQLPSNMLEAEVSGHIAHHSRAHTNGVAVGVLPEAAAAEPPTSTHSKQQQKRMSNPASADPDRAQSLPSGQRSESRQQQTAGQDSDPAWSSLHEHFSEKLKGLQRQMADPEGPDGLAGYFPAHLWQQLHQHLPATASQLLSPPVPPGRINESIHSAQSLCRDSPAPPADTDGHPQNPASFASATMRFHMKQVVIGDGPSDAALEGLINGSALPHAAELGNPSSRQSGGAADGRPDSASQLSARQGPACTSARLQGAAKGSWGPVWLHDDLSCANVLLHRAGPDAALTHVQLLDFGDAAPGHPLTDFVILHVRGFRCLSLCQAHSFSSLCLP